MWRRASVQVVSYQDRIAEATEETAAPSTPCSIGQTLALDQFSSLLAEALALLGQPASPADQSRPSSARRRPSTCTCCATTCNQLPLSLAQDERGQAGKHGRPTELARVYVNLETERRADAGRGLAPSWHRRA